MKDNGHRLAVRKNDLVQVLAGKDRGKRGKVLRVIPKTERVLVERVNLVKRHQKAGRTTQQAGIIEKENPLHVSNVQLVCGKCDKPARTGRSVLADGKVVRICRRCGEVVD
jgi:large subunit ribosomal protein L24